MPKSVSHLDKAFNRGSDARLAGRPQSANPYPRGRGEERALWLRGWWDVHAHWGDDAKHYVRPLSDVKEVDHA